MFSFYSALNDVHFAVWMSPVVQSSSPVQWLYPPVPVFREICHWFRRVHTWLWKLLCHNYDVFILVFRCSVIPRFHIYEWVKSSACWWDRRHDSNNAKMWLSALLITKNPINNRSDGSIGDEVHFLNRCWPLKCSYSYQVALEANTEEENLTHALCPACTVAPCTEWQCL